jgi:two-component system response regulator AtoC
LGPFVKVSCAAIPGQLLESELFGYEKGAFTGAYSTKLGRIESADQGTLFLDEIGELDRDLQAKLLHVLQDGYFTRIGDSQERKIDSRVICVTNRNLGDDILNGKFRQDLFYRISVIGIHLPPLRDRRQDIPFLADHFVALFNERYERTAPPLSAEAREALRQDEWPGNIRELENTIARYVLFGIDEVLMSRRGHRRRSAVSVGMKEDETIPLKVISKDVVQEKEREVILKALEANRWNRRRTAEILKMSYRSLLYKIQRT